MAHFSFTKMHGAGNDFVILDARTQEITLTAEQIAHLSDRHVGVGCDQFIILRPSAEADIQMDIYNSDGSVSGACGNATRCVAWLLMQETAHTHVTIKTIAGILSATQEKNGQVTVDMGKPRLHWQEIPLAEPMDTLQLTIGTGPLTSPTAVSMGNPHLVFFVKDTASIDLPRLGPILEHHPLLPERANINVAEIHSPTTIKLRVWERGCGETLACGSGACATLVAASRRGLTGRKAEIYLPGGTLSIYWREEDDHVVMTGPVAVSFMGSFSI